MEQSVALGIAESKEPVFCGVVRGELGGGDDHCAGSGGDDTTVEAWDALFDVDGSAGACDGGVAWFAAGRECLQADCE